jgi:hypothetical protein
VRILDERFGGVRVEVAHVQVQGMEAPQQIIRALNYFNGQPEPPDVIAIVRGGGSADDLSAFDDESLVRAYGSSAKEVIAHAKLIPFVFKERVLFSTIYSLVPRFEHYTLTQNVTVIKREFQSSL